MAITGVTPFTGNFAKSPTGCPGAFGSKTGTPARNCPTYCATAGAGGTLCGKDADHKGWVSIGVTGIDPVPFHQGLIDGVNANAEAMRCHQAMIELLHLWANGVPTWTADSFKIGRATPVWKSFTYTLTSVTNWTISGTWSGGNDPANASFQNSALRTLKCWGILTVSNSILSENARFIIYSLSSTAEGAVTLYSATAVPDNLLTKINGANPVTATFVCYDAGAQEQWTHTKRIYPFWTEEMTVTLDTFTAGINDLDASPCYPYVGAPYTTIEKNVGGVWSALSGAVKNQYDGSGGFKTVLDLTGATLTGVTQVRATFQGRVTPTSTQFETATPVIVNDVTNAMTAEVIEASATLYGTGWKVEEDHEDAWHDVQGAVIRQEGSDIVLDLSEATLTFWTNPEPPGEPVEMPITSVRCTWDHVTAVATHQSAQCLCSAMCAYSIEDFTGKIGVADADGRRFTCAKWAETDPALSADDKTAFMGSAGRCMNSYCPYFAVYQDIMNPLDGVPDAISAHTFHQWQQTPMDETSTYLYRDGHPSLATLTRDRLYCDSGRYELKVYELSDTAYGFGGAVENEYEAYTPEPTEEDPDPDPVMLTTAGIVRGLEYVDETDDQGRASQVPLTRGLNGKHRYSGADIGQWGKCAEAIATTLVFPNLNLVTTDWQVYPDGEVKVSYFDANGEELPDATGSVGRIKVRHKNTIRAIKFPSEEHDLAVVTTCTVGAVSAGPTLALNHKQTNVSKPAGTNEANVIVAVYLGGTNVIPLNSQRATNPEAVMAVSGAGGSSVFISAGMFLEIPSLAEVPGYLRGRLIKITGAIPMDATLQSVDPNYNTTTNQQRLENVLGLSNLVNPQYRDSITIEDDAAGSWAALDAACDVTTLTFNVLETCWASSFTSAVIAGPDSVNGTNQANACVLELPWSGIYVLQDPPTANKPCLVVNEEGIYRGSLWSVTGDLAPITATLERIMN